MITQKMLSKSLPGFKVQMGENNNPVIVNPGGEVTSELFKGSWRMNRKAENQTDVANFLKGAGESRHYRKEKPTEPKKGKAKNTNRAHGILLSLHGTIKKAARMTKIINQYDGLVTIETNVFEDARALYKQFATVNGVVFDGSNKKVFTCTVPSKHIAELEGMFI